MQHRFDPIYRHGLAVADDGCTLLMVSTTGSVLLSENGGDSWRTVSNAMPPVSDPRVRGDDEAVRGRLTYM